ncbi:MAG: DUF1854 domain-containing protein [Myxococcales bacterium]|nr:DUF1854 domain-containing protein [Myxococcales bacterium]
MLTKSTTEATQIRTASAERPLRFARRADGRLWLLGAGREVPVRPVRCFPWSAPGHHVSLRDDQGEECAYVSDPRELDACSRAALASALADAGLVLRITSVDHIEDDQEIRYWTVRTLQGRRTFQTRLETWPRPEPGGGLLVEDVSGDLYWIPDPTTLDTHSQKRLWAYVD